MKENRFMHISDLHFFRANHSKSSKDDFSQFEIKRQILGSISSVIQEYEIGAVLISGDLGLDSTDDIIPFFNEWVALGSSVFLVFGEHDSKELRKELITETKDLNGLYIFDDFERIENDRLNYCVSGMSCESKQNDFRSKFNRLASHMHTKPAIFLTHPCNLSTNKMKELGFAYYAVGHIHYHNIEKIDRNIFIGRPGHLFSLWDGNGKAWPVGAIIGEFIDRDLELQWHPFPVAQTVRLFIDPHNAKAQKTPLIIENCSFDKGGSIARFIEGVWVDQKFRGVFKGFIEQGLEKPELSSVIKKVLEIFIDDIFVTPSDSHKMRKKYGYNRGVFAAKTLLSDPLIFEEFLDRIVKASSKTQ